METPNKFDLHLLQKPDWNRTIPQAERSQPPRRHFGPSREGAPPLRQPDRQSGKSYRHQQQRHLSRAQISHEGPWVVAGCNPPASVRKPGFGGHGESQGQKTTPKNAAQLKTWAIRGGSHKRLIPNLSRRFPEKFSELYYVRRPGRKETLLSERPRSVPRVPHFSPLRQ